jgi:hypothetical protein
MEKTNCIKSALYLQDWNFDTGDKKYLKKHADTVTPLEYRPNMKGHIFCPECCVGLFRSPEGKDYDRNGRKAFYAHTSKHTPECSLRTKRTEGGLYETEKQAKRAVEKEELVIVKNFMKSKPLSQNIDSPSGYQNVAVEGENGGLLQVPLAKHSGEGFKLPSRVTTIKSFCRNFDENLHRWFLLPNEPAALKLQDHLIDVASVTETCDHPKIYFGKVKWSSNRGETSRNIRQTELFYIQHEPYEPHNYYADFSLKATDEDSREHGIDDDSTGKIVLMYGKVTLNGAGLCIEHLGWGEFAVLPAKYAELLYENA